MEDNFLQGISQLHYIYIVPCCHLKFLLIVSSIVHAADIVHHALNKTSGRLQEVKKNQKIINLSAPKNVSSRLQEVVVYEGL